ncbi:MAG TPA: glycosyltransferase family 87 protein [Abditibacteriaceae bacterium]|jgi:hypothetical protein
MMANGAFWRRMGWRITQAFAVVHIALQLAVWLPLFMERTHERRDAPIYYRAARAALTRQPLYRNWPNYNPHKDVPTVYLYPPSFAAVFAPLGKLTLLQFTRVWYLLLLVAFWIYAACLARLAGAHGFWPIAVAGLVLQLFPGTIAAMSLGNAEPLMWMLFGLALTYRRGRGAWLMTAALIKVHPVWALSVACVREGRRVARPAFVTLVTGGLLGALVCGAESYAVWRMAALPVVSQGCDIPGNVSLSFSALRLFWAWSGDAANGRLSSGARAWLTLCALAGPLLASWLARRSSVEMHITLVACAAIVCGPLCWTLYLPVFLLPAALWYAQLRAKNTVEFNRRDGAYV